jgi:hypothetical protein
VVSSRPAMLNAFRNAACGIKHFPLLYFRPFYG